MRSSALFDATGMIHSDVKPANILVSPTGHATLLDFGFAQSPSEGRHWSTRPIAGTLAYIAPEMVTSALAADPRADVYSLGVTLYEMLAGRRPFESDDPGELATLQREAKPADVRQHRPELPETGGLPDPVDARQRSAAPARLGPRAGPATSAAGNRQLRVAVSARQSWQSWCRVLHWGDSIRTANPQGPRRHGIARLVSSRPRIALVVASIARPVSFRLRAGGGDGRRE